MSAGDTARVLAALETSGKLAPGDPLVRQFAAAARDWQHQTQSENP
jgi:hypothetical protein